MILGIFVSATRIPELIEERLLKRIKFKWPQSSANADLAEALGLHEAVDPRHCILAAAHKASKAGEDLSHQLVKSMW